MKEMTGSGIFAAKGENDELESGSDNSIPNGKTGLRMYQVCVRSFILCYEKIDICNSYQCLEHNLFVSILFC